MITNTTLLLVLALALIVGMALFVRRLSGMKPDEPVRTLAHPPTQSLVPLLLLTVIACESVALGTLFESPVARTQELIALRTSTLYEQQPWFDSSLGQAANVALPEIVCPDYAAEMGECDPNAVIEYRRGGVGDPGYDPGLMGLPNSAVGSQEATDEDAGFFDRTSSFIGDLMRNGYAFVEENVTQFAETVTTGMRRTVRALSGDDIDYKIADTAPSGGGNGTENNGSPRVPEIPSMGVTSMPQGQMGGPPNTNYSNEGLNYGAENNNPDYGHEGGRFVGVDPMDINTIAWTDSTRGEIVDGPFQGGFVLRTRDTDGKIVDVVVIPENGAGEGAYTMAVLDKNNVADPARTLTFIPKIGEEGSHHGFIPTEGGPMLQTDGGYVAPETNNRGAPAVYIVRRPDGSSYEGNSTIIPDSNIEIIPSPSAGETFPFYLRPCEGNSCASNEVIVLDDPRDTYTAGQNNPNGGTQLGADDGTDADTAAGLDPNLSRQTENDGNSTGGQIDPWESGGPGEGGAVRDPSLLKGFLCMLGICPDDNPTTNTGGNQSGGQTGQDSSDADRAAGLDPNLVHQTGNGGNSTGGRGDPWESEGPGEGGGGGVPVDNVGDGTTRGITTPQAMGTNDSNNSMDNSIRNIAEQPIGGDVGGLGTIPETVVDPATTQFGMTNDIGDSTGQTTHTEIPTQYLNQSDPGAMSSVDLFLRSMTSFFDFGIGDIYDALRNIP